MYIWGRQKIENINLTSTKVYIDIEIDKKLFEIDKKMFEIDKKIVWDRQKVIIIAGMARHTVGRSFLMMVCNRE